MIKTKELKTFDEFFDIKKGDALACEFHTNVHDYPKVYRFKVFIVADNKREQNEIILQNKNNIYFNYKMFCDGGSHLKSAVLITSEDAPQDIKEQPAQPTADQVPPCVHKWGYGMFYKICAKCGLVDDA